MAKIFIKMISLQLQYITFAIFQTEESFLAREPRVAGKGVAPTIVRRG